MSRYVIEDEPSQQGRFVIESGPAITMPNEQQRLENAYAEIARRNSFGGNLLDGAATAAQRYALGAKQMFGGGTQADKNELRAAEKAFGGTVGGVVGDVVGTAVPAVAATMIPGGNTLVGQMLAGAGMGAFMPADSAAERGANTGAGAAIGGVAKVGGDKIAQWVASRGAAKAAQLTAANEVRDGAITASRAAGYTIPPASANPTFTNSALEGFAGKLSTAQSAAIKNQPVTNSLVRSALRLPDDAPLTRDTLVGIRKEAAQAYSAVRGLGQITPDTEFLQSVDDVGARFASAAKDFPKVVGKEASDLVDSFRVKQFDANSAVDAIQVLREQAEANLTAFAKGSEKSLGRAQRQLADALEAQLERYASATGTPEMVASLREARTLIAKTYSVEKALRDGTGNISARELAKQLAKGKPLSSELRTVAVMGQNFPKAVQDVTSSMPGVSPLDFGLAGTVGALTGSPAALAMVAGRPTVRSMILSPAYQRMAVNAPNYGPGMLSRGTVGLLGRPAGQAAITAGLLGEATE